LKAIGDGLGRRRSRAVAAVGSVDQRHERTTSDGAADAAQEAAVPVVVAEVVVNGLAQVVGAAVGGLLVAMDGFGEQPGRRRSLAFGSV
jgi:hypothetical protein